MWWWILACATPDGPADRPGVHAAPPSSVDSGTPQSTAPSDTGTTAPTGHTGDTGRRQTTTTPTWTPPDFPVALEPGPPVICADPAARDDRPFDRVELPASAAIDEALPGSGVLVADLTGDGLPELLFAGTGWIDAWRWDGAAWVPAGDLLPPDLPAREVLTFSAADVDGDADLDVFVGTGSQNLLLRNEGGVLVDGTAGSGLEHTAWESVSASWADFDRDGDLDLVVGNYGTGPDEGSVLLRPAFPSELYRNDGGVFTDVSHELPAEVHEGFVFMTAWVDLEPDGWPDLLTVHDFGWVRAPSRILRNRGGRGFRLDPATGFHPDFAGMGITIADVDRDGGVDIAQSSASELSLRLAQPDPVALVDWTWRIESGPSYGLFVDVHERGQRFGWGLDFSDIDHDGDEDLPVVFGWWSEYPDLFVDQHDGLYLYDSNDRKFTDVAAAWQVDDPAAGRGLAVADVNGDGWPDLVKRQLGLAPNVVHTSRCGSARWLRVRLADDATVNRHAIGARLEVQAGIRRHTRWIQAGSRSMFASVPAEAHIGLGDESVVDLTVVWPDGQRSTFAGLDADRVVTVRRTP